MLVVMLGFQKQSAERLAKWLGSSLQPCLSVLWGNEACEPSATFLQNWRGEPRFVQRISLGLVEQKDLAKHQRCIASSLVKMGLSSQRLVFLPRERL